MEYGWFSLFPPLIVVVVAYITNQINPALIAGIISACFIGTNFSIVQTGKLFLLQSWAQLNSFDNICLYAFLALIGVLITLLNHCGSAYAFATNIGNRVKSPIGAQLFSTLLSSILALDDYLSILTTGHVMQPIAHRFHIPREKIAFLVHSMATPVVLLVPISSWVGLAINNVSNSHLTNTPLTTYLSTIPFIFYSFFAIFSVFFIILTNTSFGPMQKVEESIINTNPPTTDTNPNASIWGLLIPTAILVVGILIGLPYSGGFWLLGGTKSFFESLQHSHGTFAIMLASVLVALLTSIAIGKLEKTLQIQELPRITRNGISLMSTAVVMVFLAGILSNLLSEVVKTGEFLSSMLLNTVFPETLPALLFIVSLACTLSAGSSWGTIGLLPPVVIPMTVGIIGSGSPISATEHPLILAVLGAVFSGALCGDHLSPFSETTTMTATSTGTTPFNHAKTQFPYMIPAIIGTLSAFAAIGPLLSVVGSVASLSISLIIGVTMCTGILSIIPMVWHKN